MLLGIRLNLQDGMTLIDSGYDIKIYYGERTWKYMYDDVNEKRVAWKRVQDLLVSLSCTGETSTS